MKLYIDKPQDITAEFKWAIFGSKCLAATQNIHAYKHLKAGTLLTYNNFMIINDSKRFFITQKLHSGIKDGKYTHIHLN